MSEFRDDLALLFDCDCSPYGTPEELRAYLPYLTRKRMEWHCNRQAMAPIGLCREQVERYLSCS